MDENERILDEMSTHGVLTTDVELVKRIPDWMLSRHLDAAGYRFLMARKVRDNLSHALGPGPDSQDGVLMAAARGCSLQDYCADVIAELELASRILETYTAESSRRFHERYEKME